MGANPLLFRKSPRRHATRMRCTVKTKGRISNKYYYFFISFTVTLCIIALLLSMYVSYSNTRKTGFGETSPPIEIYRQVNGEFVFVLGENKYKFRPILFEKI
jgi:hypothetical protein